MRISRFRSGGYLSLTDAGMAFIKRWFGTEKRIPPENAKLYQLLLKTAMMKGVVTFLDAARIAGSREAVQEAISKNFLRPLPRGSRPPDGVLRDIEELIGEPPRQMYV